MRRHLLGLALASASCASAPPTGDRPIELEIATVSGPADTSAPRGERDLPRGTRPNLDGWAPPHFQDFKIGERCRSDPAADRSRPQTRRPDGEPDIFCGTAQRVSLELQYGVFRPDLPEPPCTLMVFDHLPQMQTHRLRLCVVGDHMLIESSCLVCRAAWSGSLVHVRLSELTLAQNEFLNDTMLFEKGRGPSTASEWEALAGRAAAH